MRYTMVALCLPVILHIGCTDNPSEPEGKAGFLLHVQVRDLMGQPSEGLRVSAWNKRPIATEGEAAPPARTRMQYTVPVRSQVNMIVRELDGTLYSELFVDKERLPGTYAADFSTDLQPSTRVWVCIFTARDSLGNQVLFQDSIFMCYWSNNPSVTQIGFTDAEGTFETDDALLFPHLFDPPIYVTNSSGPEVLEVYTLSDTVAIAITDTSTNRQQVVEAALLEQWNVVGVTWSGTGTTASSVHADRRYRGDYVPHRPIRAIPMEWQLSQNYPNPFN